MINLKIGELTTQQIVLLIILLVSFAIILIFIFILDLGGETNAEICHNSVVTKGSDVVPSDAVSLKCQTNYVCISEDGSCERLTGPRIERVKTEAEVYGVLAEEMRSCWWTFGEGKVDYVGSDLFPGRYCSICSQVAFDDSVDEIFSDGRISEDIFYNEYLSKTKMKGTDQFYTEYLFGARDFSRLHDGDFLDFRIDRQYLVMMGSSSKLNKIGWAGLGAASVGAFLIFAPVSVPFVAGVLITGVSGGAGYYIATISEGDSGNEYLRPTIIEANSNAYKGLQCDSVLTYS